MDFLKELFGTEALTYEQLAAKVAEKKWNVVDISGGAYVSRAKFDDRTRTLEEQVNDLKNQITQRDTDTAALKEQLTAAQGDAGKLTALQQSLVDLQAKYEADNKAWADKLATQTYTSLVREKANTLSFTSPAAKRDFISQLTAKALSVEGDTILGGDDFVTKYKEENPGALVEEKPADQNPEPQIVAPAGGKPKPGARVTLSEAMQKANNDPNYRPTFD